MNQAKNDTLSKALTPKLSPYAREEQKGRETLHDDPNNN